MLTRAITLSKVIILLLCFCGVVPTKGIQQKAFAQRMTLYTPYPKISVPPGEIIDYSVDIINNTGSVQTADISLVGVPKGWTYELKSGGWTVEQIAVLPREK